MHQKWTQQGWEFETTMINMLRDKWIMDKVDSMQKQTGNVSRDGNPKEKSKRNARLQKSCNRNEKCL